MSMTIGEYFKISIFGESHGPAIGAVIDGVPAGTEISLENIMLHMRRRAPGRPGTTPRAETDIPEFLSGIFNGDGRAHLSYNTQSKHQERRL